MIVSFVFRLLQLKLMMMISCLMKTKLKKFLIVFSGRKKQIFTKSIENVKKLAEFSNRFSLSLLVFPRNFPEISASVPEIFKHWIKKKKKKIQCPSFLPYFFFISHQKKSNWILFLLDFLFLSLSLWHFIFSF